VVCDLSEPGPVFDLPHVKDMNIKVEEKMCNNNVVCVEISI